ncbi:nitroreductase family deazaflavin-dependent oxidoreductase [Gordonia sp. ABSL11-1]|uniref:nitroreductase family deazaflavin-dependent oxidoreductase n=1 Tax=Gordonia sp. ABSL11-1 TaxID=3053924 RepID=UPI0025745DEF|nr:nitroreductase family deazaflavin-dependent oxidoreductase [Gordonia sp. ABSL11-1]MDL9948156.1 nitroreductase family deazaflavin-dependent oxidoreductase [Gordonia sp. ABSL11-1]
MTLAGTLSSWIRRLISHPLLYRHVVLRASAVTGIAEATLRRCSSGRIGVLDAAGLASLQITVVGRKTGQPRTVTLQCITDGEDLLVTDSNWGRPHPPAWAANLAAADTAVVRFQRADFVVAVQHSIGTARIRDWSTICAQWPNFAVAQSISGREFRVFRLRPDRRQPTV